MTTINKLFLAFTSILCLSSLTEAQKISYDSKIKSVTVFFSGAQITRECAVNIPTGKSIIVLKGLSQWINKESIQITNKSNANILAINQRLNYFDYNISSKKEDTLYKKLEELNDELSMVLNDFETEKEKLSIFEQNKNILQSQSSFSFESFKKMNEYYCLNIEKLRNSIFNKRKRVDAIKKEISLINQQRSVYHPIDTLVSGEIILSLISSAPQQTVLEFSYFVSKAGWYPSYDFRVSSIKNPMELALKANVYQNTGIDWQNVPLTFSNSDPGISSDIPRLQPYVLNQQRNQKYDIASALQGRVAGVEINRTEGNSTIRVRGANYVNQYEPLYVIDGIPVSHAPNISPDDIEKVSVLADASACSVYGNRGANGVIILETKSAHRQKNNETLMNIQYEITTNFKHTTKEKHTVFSNNEQEIIPLTKSEVPAHYEYHAVPKLNEHAFLMAKITGWKDYNLMEGKANIFFEQTYIGNTFLNIKYLSDTLWVSLGKDENIIVERLKVKNEKSIGFLGENAKQELQYMVVAKNYKGTKVQISVFDQIPISEDKSIQLSSLSFDDGKYDESTGLVKWDFEIEPSNLTDKKFNYTIKYPTYMNLNIN